MNLLLNLNENESEALLFMCKSFYDAREFNDIFCRNENNKELLDRIDNLCLKILALAGLEDCVEY